MKRKIFLLSCIFHHLLITKSVSHIGADIKEYNDGFEERSDREKKSIDTNVGVPYRWRSVGKQHRGTIGDQSPVIYQDGKNLYDRIRLTKVNLSNSPTFKGRHGGIETDDEDKSQKQKRDKNLELTKNQYEREKAAGSMADLFGSNPHYSYPTLYEDYGGKFFRKSDDKMRALEKKFYSSEEASRTEDRLMTPMRAPPEVVLAIAKQAAQLEGSKVVNPTDDLIQREILRTGDYWNAVWKEDINPAMLRSHKKTLKKKRHEKDQLEKLESIRVKIMPGTKLYELISALKRKSPRFLYVINTEEKGN